MFALFIPGLVELVSILVVLVIYLGLPVLVAVGVYNFYDGKNAYDERIEALERRVEELEQRTGE